MTVENGCHGTFCRLATVFVVAMFFGSALLAMPMDVQALDYGMRTSLAEASSSFIGEAAGDQIGQIAVGVGDVDGDHIGDFIIGSPYNGDGGSSAGQAYLFLGKNAGWAMDTAVSNADASFIGENAGDWSGYATGVGDVNGDGYDDIVIGANRNDDGGADAGQVYLIFGNSTGWSMDTSLGSSDASFIGEAAGDMICSRTRGVGDVNGDGFDDFMFVAYFQDGGGTDRGKAYLVFGKAAGWSMDTSASNADASFVGEADNDGQDMTVSGPGDVNGDGYDDVLIGVPYNDDVGTQAGQTYLILGKASGWAKDTALSNADASFKGEAATDYSSPFVSIPTDANGDGLYDIIISAHYNDDGGSEAGQAYVIFGKKTGWAMDTSLASSDASFIGEASSNFLIGHGIGDVNGDGCGDIFLTAYTNDYGGSDRGQVYLILGKVSGWSMDVSVSNADASWVGEVDVDNAGDGNHGPAGDIDGDGYNDLLIGAPANDQGGNNAGQVYLVSPDHNLPPTAVSSVKTYEGNFVNEKTTAIVGDVIYVEVSGIDDNSSRKDTAQIDVESSGSDTTGFRMGLLETGFNTGKYRGNFTITNRSHSGYRWINASIGETVKIASVEDPTKTATVSLSIGDLSLSTSDIGFSNENPEEGETVRLTARIHNDGDDDQPGVSADFYDGDPFNSTDFVKDGGIRIDLGHQGSADVFSTGQPDVIRLDNGLYRMFYQGQDAYGGNGRILSSVSEDGSTWQSETGYRVDNDKPEYNRLVGAPSIVRLDNGSYRLYFMGYDNSQTNIFSAISMNGVDFSKESGIRVQQGGVFDAGGATDPDVIRLENGTWRMYYYGNDGSTRRILSAWSSDGLTFIKEGVRLVPGGTGDATGVSDPDVVRISSNVLRMFYIGEDASNDFAVLSAISKDGLTWTKETGAIIEQGSGADKDAAAIGSQCIVKMNDGRYRLYYGGGYIDGVTKFVILSALSNLTDAVLLATVSVDIPADGSANASMTWDTMGEAGNHTISVIVDSNDVIHESDETNNIASRDIEVKEYVPGEVTVISDGDYYEPGEMVVLSVHHARGIINVTVEVDDADGDPLDVITLYTDMDGNASHIFVLPLDIPLGNYNVTASTQWRNATTNFTVASVPPVISSPPDIVYKEGETDNRIVWTGWDRNPVSYSIVRNGTTLIDQGPWSGANVSVVVDGLLKGNYTYTLHLKDIAGNMASDTVNVTVTKEVIIEVFELGDINITYFNDTLGKRFMFKVNVKNTYNVSQQALLVIQVLDPGNVPIRPLIKEVNVVPDQEDGFEYSIDLGDSPASGAYYVQVQLLTALPSDGGYAIDWEEMYENVT